MPHRFVLLESLKSLAQGNVLVQAGDTSLGLFLAGAPGVCHVFHEMRARGWIEPVATIDQPPRWRITPAGFDEYENGRRWYGSLSLKQRLLGPYGLAGLPPAGSWGGTATRAQSGPDPRH